MNSLIMARMENENWLTWTYDYLRLKLQEANDSRYIQQGGAQKLINAAVIGTIVLICTGVLSAIVGLFTGLIHMP